MKKQVSLIVLLLIIGMLNAQTSVTLSDGKFIYRLSVEQLPEPHYRPDMQAPPTPKGQKLTPKLGMAVGKVKSITIFSVKDTTHKQVIEVGKNESSWPWTETNKGEKFVIEDMNFDGNNDIRLLNSADVFTYYCWMYQPSTGQFVEDTLLEKFVNPQFDQNEKLIYQNWESVKDKTKATDIYQYIDGKLTLIEEEERTNNTDTKTVTITIKKLVRGQMTVVKKEEIPLEN